LDSPFLRLGPDRLANAPSSADHYDRRWSADRRSSILLFCLGAAVAIRLYSRAFFPPAR
jgi:hypothetical protein